MCYPLRRIRAMASHLDYWIQNVQDEQYNGQRQITSLSAETWLIVRPSFRPFILSFFRPPSIPPSVRSFVLSSVRQSVDTSILRPVRSSFLSSVRPLKPSVRLSLRPSTPPAAAAAATASIAAATAAAIIPQRLISRVTTARFSRVVHSTKQSAMSCSHLEMNRGFYTGFAGSIQSTGLSRTRGYNGMVLFHLWYAQPILY